ncbi:hypothetical protein Glove_86g83 [Diversispora epigaea]|uniref:Uncharacterized protein n=1 Tax=Diversispora epigaea TaxID=1348612 RepID=A0A397JFI6_9GLOM|nr:hypothetical protein Glove_86g83 [Diversispora epigaea]
MKTPVEERIQLYDDNLNEECLEKLNLEFNRLREFTAQLVDLWDKSEEIYELLSQEVSRLQELYAKCAKIY